MGGGGVRSRIKDKIKQGSVESRDKKMCILFMERGRHTHLTFVTFEFAAQVQVILCNTEEHTYPLLTRIRLMEMYMAEYFP